MNYKKIFVIVTDSLGIGEAKDSIKYNDLGHFIPVLSIPSLIAKILNENYSFCILIKGYGNIIECMFFLTFSVLWTLLSNLFVSQILLLIF